jgi:Ca2+-transporting ATPase
MEMWHALDKKEVLDKLKSSENGLGEKEASARLKQYGKNEIKQILKIHPFTIFLEQFKSYLLLQFFLFL